MQWLKLTQLEDGTWINVGRDEGGKRLVQDLFGRPLIGCTECGMIAHEWRLETEEFGHPHIPCCDAE